MNNTGSSFSQDLPSPIHSLFTRIERPQPTLQPPSRDDLEKSRKSIQACFDRLKAQENAVILASRIEAAKTPPRKTPLDPGSRLTPRFNGTTFNLPFSSNPSAYERGLGSALLGAHPGFEPIIRNPRTNPVLPPILKAESKIRSKPEKVIRTQAEAQLDKYGAQLIAHSSKTKRVAFCAGYTVILPHETLEKKDPNFRSPRLPGENGDFYTEGNGPTSLTFHSALKEVNHEIVEVEYLLVGTERGRVDLWNVTVGQDPVFEVSYKFFSTPVLTIHVEKGRLFAGSQTGFLVEFDLNSEEYVGRTQVHENAILEIAASPDRAWLVTGSEDGTAIFYRPQPLQKGEYSYLDQFALKKIDDRVRAISFSPNSYNLIIGGSRIPRLMLYRMVGISGVVKKCTILIDSEVNQIFWLNSSRIATTHSDGTFRVYKVDCVNGKFEELSWIQAHNGRITYAQYIPDRSLLITHCPSAREIKTWKLPYAPSKKEPLPEMFSGFHTTIR